MKIWQNAVKILPLAACLAVMVSGSGTVVRTQGSQWYAAPNGSDSNSGTISSPISLQKALGSSSPAKPGDTIWVRGGTYASAYTSYLTGTASAPITVRAYPGERAILDANNSAARSSAVLLNVYGAHTYFWGLELMSSATSRTDVGTGPNSPSGVYVRDSTNIKFINMVVHDLPGQGFGLWQENTDLELYGTLIYHNGTNHWDHGVYVQNLNGAKKITDNIIFEQASHGVHGYAEGANLNNIQLDGNTIFESGSLVGGAERNILIGGAVVAQNPVVTNNYTYYRGTDGNSNIGYSAGASNATIKNNYFIAGNVAVRLINLTGSTSISGNFMEGPLDPSNTQSLYPSNTFASSRPTTGQTVFVRPNKYETGRANITIYNWGKASTASVNLSNVGLASGDTFEIRDAQNFFGNPVVTGTYTGAAVTVPMTGLTPVAPIGGGLVFVPHTAPEFGTFVVLKKSSGGGGGGGGTGDTTAPTVSVTAPAGGATVSGSVTLTANAADNVGVAGVTFKVDGAAAGAEDTSAPYSLAWATTGVANGTHTITATARDAAGNTTTSSTVSVTVSNGGAPPSPPTGLHIVAEAEAGQLHGAMSIKSDASASGGKYVSTNTANSGSVYFTFTAPNDGIYAVWGRVYAPDSNHDSFTVYIDGINPDIYDVAEGKWAANWQWTTVNGRGGSAPNTIVQRQFPLKAGAHTFRFDGREVDTRLDKIEITDDLKYIPLP